MKLGLILAIQQLELTLAAKNYPGVVGREGVIDDKREGDNTTPAGCFRILKLYYRSDRVKDFNSAIPKIAIQPDDIWIDDPSDPGYNQPAKREDTSQEANRESLWREDHLYDLVLDLDYNRQPALTGKGSAIFVHIARNEIKPATNPTAGCIALSKIDLLEILSQASSQTQVCVHLE